MSRFNLSNLTEVSRSDAFITKAQVRDAYRTINFAAAAASGGRFQSASLSVCVVVTVSRIQDAVLMADLIRSRKRNLKVVALLDARCVAENPFHVALLVLSGVSARACEDFDYTSSETVIVDSTAPDDRTVATFWHKWEESADVFVLSNGYVGYRLDMARLYAPLDIVPF